MSVNPSPRGGGEHMVGGAIGDDESGRLLERDRRRDRRERARRNRDLLARRPPSAIAHHPVARPDGLDRLPNGLDDAGKLRRRREWRIGLELVLSFDDQRIEEIEAGRLHRNHRLLRSGLRRGQVLKLEIGRRSECLAQHSFHETIP
jgi:hypothetical protein